MLPASRLVSVLFSADTDVGGRIRSQDASTKTQNKIETNLLATSPQNKKRRHLNKYQRFLKFGFFELIRCERVPILGTQSTRLVLQLQGTVRIIR